MKLVKTSAIAVAMSALLVGPVLAQGAASDTQTRGSGKTHTLAVALHRALADPKATKAVALAWIPEDSLSISSYRDLLVEAARALSPELTEQARALRRARDHVGLEQLIEGYAAPRTVADHWSTIRL